MTQAIDRETGEIVSAEGHRFDPSRYLRKLGGKDYLEVKWRLLWVRTEHPDATVKTEMVRLEDGFALFKAHVAIPEGGEATGWGSETKQDFFDYIEKAETKALGRALAALGYGTQFCEDFDFSAGAPEGRDKIVDSPVERGGSGSYSNGNGSGQLATPAQLKLIYLTAERDLRISEEELEERCQSQYGRLPLHLTKREASEFIDGLKKAAAGGPGGHSGRSGQEKKAAGQGGERAANGSEKRELPVKLTADEAQALKAAGIDPHDPPGMDLIYCRRELLKLKPGSWPAEVRERNLKSMVKYVETRAGLTGDQLIALCCGIVAVTWGRRLDSEEVLDEMPVNVIAFVTGNIDKIRQMKTSAEWLLENWIRR